jgi:glycosyltransferase involved in cell wall biosynthesis
MPHLLSIIVPVFNESRTVQQVIDRLLTVELPVDREIVVVNDGSTDGTGRVLDRMPASPEILRIVHASHNAGKGSAVRLGLQHARGSIIAIQDADLELDPVQLADLVRPIVDGETHVVYGSRFLTGRPDAPWLTVAANKLLTSVTNVLYGSRLTDMETCYKLMAADVVRGLNLTASRFDIEPEITGKLLRAGHRIVERPVRFEPRARSEGKKIRWRDGMHALRTLVRHRFGR